MSEYIDFNINYHVKVKLTKEGRSELKRQHEEMKSMWPSVGDFKESETDEDGYSRFQLWSLMGSLGHLCQMGMVGHPFETDIKIQHKEK